jgi:hypothetical protein
MPNPSFRIAEFECPDCGFEGSFAGLCPSCGCPLFDQRCAEPWQLAAKRSTQERLGIPWVLLAIYGAVPLGFSIALGTGLCFGLFLLLIGMFFITFISGSNRWREFVLKRRYATTQRQPLNEAREGQRVAISGMPTVHTKALAPAGIDALAYELHYARKPEYANEPMIAFLGKREFDVPFVCQTGGAFSMVVDGIEVRAKLEHFVLLTPVVDRARMIPEGTPIRISGLARWVRDENRMGLRSDGRVLELYGTENEPMLIEPIPLEQWLDTTSTAPTNTAVRVDTTSPDSSNSVIEQATAASEPHHVDGESLTRSR